MVPEGLIFDRSGTIFCDRSLGIRTQAVATRFRISQSGTTKWVRKGEALCAERDWRFEQWISRL
jgi:hypothetical protein